jgi:hypothetical protein
MVLGRHRAQSRSILQAGSKLADFHFAFASWRDGTEQAIGFGSNKEKQTRAARVALAFPLARKRDAAIISHGGVLHGVLHEAELFGASQAQGPSSRAATIPDIRLDDTFGLSASKRRKLISGHGADAGSSLASPSSSCVTCKGFDLIVRLSAWLAGANVPDHTKRNGVAEALNRGRRGYTVRATGRPIAPGGLAHRLSATGT